MANVISTRPRNVIEWAIDVFNLERKLTCPNSPMVDEIKGEFNVLLTAFNKGNTLCHQCNPSVI